MTDPLLAAFLESTVRSATPLALAALGELLIERTGVINLGGEGCIISGALAATIAASSFGVTSGLVAGAGAGVIVALAFASFAVLLRTDQIITGMAVTLGALGLTSAVYRIWFGTTGVALSIPTLSSISIPGLSAIPVIGGPFFDQPVTTYVAYLACGAIAWFLFRTKRGLVWRATGESAEAVLVTGMRPAHVQLAAALVAGALAGLAGATLVVAQVGTFADGMSAGRGYVAIVAVALGRWQPLGVLGASVLFGASTALQYLLQATGVQLPYQLFLALPYVVALAVLALGAGRTRAPAALGRAVTGELQA